MKSFAKVKRAKLKNNNSNHRSTQSYEWNGTSTVVYQSPDEVASINYKTTLFV